MAVRSSRKNIIQNDIKQSINYYLLLVQKEPFNLFTVAIRVTVISYEPEWI